MADNKSSGSDDETEERPSKKVSSPCSLLHPLLTIAQQKATGAGPASSPFVDGTTEVTWSPEGAKDRKYILRHIHGETSCEAPFDGVEGWPTFTYVRSEEGEPDYTYVLSAIAGVWTAEGKFIAFWGSDEGDGHVEFYCRDDYEHADEDLADLSGILCTEICPPLIDTFDDGSGQDRELTKLSPAVFSNEELNSLYQQH